MNAPVDVTQATFKNEVIEADTPVLVDFWAEWCGPCRKLSPLLDEIAQEMAGQVKVAKVNVDNERALGAMFQVMSIPAVMLFKDSKKVDTAALENDPDLKGIFEAGGFPVEVPVFSAAESSFRPSASRFIPAARWAPRWGSRWTAITIRKAGRWTCRA